jgi:hypothetical protein
MFGASQTIATDISGTAPRLLGAHRRHGDGTTQGGPGRGGPSPWFDAPSARPKFGLRFSILKIHLVGDALFGLLTNAN